MTEAPAFLVVEDSHGDFLLIKRHCQQQGLTADWHRVDRAQQLQDALFQGNWALALFDYHVPGLHFGQSLQLIQSLQPDLPVILLSGSIGEEKAIDLIKLGVRDFVLKNNMERLVPTIRNTLREAEEIRARHAANAQLAREHLRLQTILRTASDGIHIINSEGLLVEANQAFLDMLGYDERAIGLLRVADWDAQDNWQVIKGRNDRLMVEGGKLFFETSHRRSDGRIIQVELNICALEIEGERFVYASSRDVTERKLAESKVREMAYCDYLTGLANRRMLRDGLSQSLAACARNKHTGGLIFIDLDHFKGVNDMFGHGIGDKLLQEVARRLKECFRADDLVARIGGDEFMVVLNELGDDSLVAARGANAAAVKVVEALQQPYELEDCNIVSTVSAGITLFSDSSATIDDIMKQADAALYQAKAAGRNNFCFFDLSLQSALIARSLLESELRHGIGQGQLLVLYQPQIDRDGRLIGAESLVRWRHPQRGMISPNEFIPMAEDTGLILPLGQWVLEMACGQLAVWQTQAGTTHLTVAVNVSAQQFRQKDFVETVVAVVTQSGVDPRRLKLELTESMLLDNVPTVIAKMDQLRKLGLSFSLDDFGTGYSSLSYLKLLPMSQLKIDQSFIRDLVTSPNDRAIARTIIILAESLGMNVIAEGVEETEQRAILDSFGCHAYQGYLFSRPLPANDFEQFVRQNIGMTSIKAN